MEKIINIGSDNNKQDLKKRFTAARITSADISNIIAKPKNNTANFYLDESIEDSFFPKTVDDKIHTNIKIIKLAKELTENHQAATKEQQELLAKYVGWGGLANAFFDDHQNKYEKERTELAELVTDKELRSIKESVNTAFYTDPKITRKMWKLAINCGLSSGNILDPSMGTGLFYMTMPKELQGKVNLYGIELDSITGMIAKLLFPDAKIFIKGFQNIEFQNEEFDLVISNIPFGNIKVLSKYGTKKYLIHDYFIKKSIAVTKEKGLILLISSMGVLNKKNNNINDEIEKEARFIGAVRLPNIAFKQIANTNVSADIIMYQKGKFNTNGDKLKRIQIGEEGDYQPKYFADHPDQILGTYEFKHFNGSRLSVKFNSNDDYLNKLDEAMNRFNLLYSFEDIRKEFNNIASKDIEISHHSDTLAELTGKGIKPFEFGLIGNNVYYISDDKVYKNQIDYQINYYVDNSSRFVTFGNTLKRDIERFNENTKNFQKNIIDTYVERNFKLRGKYKDFHKATATYLAELTLHEKKLVSAFIKIKLVYQKLISAQINNNSNAKVNELIKELNDVYEEFHSKYGAVNSLNKVDSLLLRRDNRFALVASLEERQDVEDGDGVVFTKGIAFRKPIIKPNVTIEKVKSANDALLLSIAQGKDVDLGFMQEVYPNHSKEEIIKELGDEILPDVERYVYYKELKYISKDDALSGDIYTKIEGIQDILKSNVDKDSYDWKHYLKLLKAVKPESLTINDISFRLSSKWIPNSIFKKFFIKTFVTKNYKSDELLRELVDNRDMFDNTVFGRSINNEYVDRWHATAASKSYLVTNETESVEYYGTDIFTYMLESKQPTLYYKEYDPLKRKDVRKIDHSNTQQLRLMENKLEAQFEVFINSSSENIASIEKAYNRRFNRTVGRFYNGEKLFVNGLSLNYNLRDYQKNLVLRIIKERRALIAHEVGAGKTLEMLSAAFKLKELGLVNRPLVVVPTNLVQQFAQDAFKFYPNKNILVVEKGDVNPAKRKRFLAKVVSSDFDAVVIGDSQFKMIPMSLSFQKDCLEEQIEFFERHLSDGGSIKKVQQKINSLKTNYKTIQHQIDSHQDNFLSFEELGIDFLFVDEAHNYKNVAPVSNLGRIKGVNSQTSQRAFDLQQKVKYLHKMHNGRNVVFATGTPVSNSISEIWTMMDYLEPEVLKHYLIDKFDDFVGSFGLVDQILELGVNGNEYRIVKRFVKFVNLPELIKIYHIVADIKMLENTNLYRPVGDKIVIKSELTKAQQDKLEELIERTDEIRGGEVKPEEDNMLKVTNEARKLTLDMRLFSPTYIEDDSNKIAQLLDNVIRIYKRTENHSGVQMIFSDLGTPTGKSSDNTFNVYDDIKERLIKEGIPKQEIAFVQSADTDAKKEKLQKLVNAGHIRVLLGSTVKGGTGLNFQKRLKAVHHLDVPWRPSDITQRNGRAVRQGNIYKHVEIYYYITKGSFDNYLWQIQENKLKYITQIMTEQSPLRSMKDIDQETLTAADFKAIATANPYLKEKMETDNALSLLINEKNSYVRRRSQFVNDKQAALKKVPVIEKYYQKVLDDKEDISKEEIIEFGNEAAVIADKDANKRLRTEISKVIRTLRLEGKAKIAKYRGFTIEVDYGSYYDVRRAMFNSQYITVYLANHNTYAAIQVDINALQHSRILERISNYISNFDNIVGQAKANLANTKETANISIPNPVFPKNLDILYLAGKKKVLDTAISSHIEIDKTAKRVQDYNEDFVSQHQDYHILKMEDKPKSTKTNFEFNPDNYDDSIFGEKENSESSANLTKQIIERHEPKELNTKQQTTKSSVDSKETTKVSVNLSKKNSKKRKTTKAKAVVKVYTEQLDLFAEFTSDEEVDDKPKKVKHTVTYEQVSLF